MVDGNNNEIISKQRSSQNTASLECMLAKIAYDKTKNVPILPKPLMPTLAGGEKEGYFNGFNIALVAERAVDGAMIY
jgi:hypothetical protein